MLPLLWRLTWGAPRGASGAVQAAHLREEWKVRQAQRHRENTGHVWDLGDQLGTLDSGATSLVELSSCLVKIGTNASERQPCDRSGGDVIVEHAGIRKVFQTAPNSRFGVTWLAWFSDVLHQVQEVVSGHRIVLTYNLLKDSAVSLTAQQICGDGLTPPALIEALRRWEQGPRKEQRLGYVLDYEVSFR